jgi:hypothetical protein
MIRTMSPQRRSDQEYRLRTAYRANGFTVAASGRVLARPQPLRPAGNPPDVSKLPSPSRTPTMTTPAPLRKQVATYDEIPRRLRPAYDLSPLGWYEPNQIGTVIGAYRSALARDPHSEPVFPLTKLTRKEWSMLLSVVEPGEQPSFIRALVSKRIKLKD